MVTRRARRTASSAHARGEDPAFLNGREAIRASPKAECRLAIITPQAQRDYVRAGHADRARLGYNPAIGRLSWYRHQEILAPIPRTSDPVPGRRVDRSYERAGCFSGS